MDSVTEVPTLPLTTHDLPGTGTADTRAGPEGSDTSWRRSQAGNESKEK